MPLPQARLTIEKMYQGEYWTNVYWLSTDLSDSAAAAVDILAAERAITLSPVLFTKMRIDDGVEDTDVFVTSSPNLFGLRSPGGNEMVPLFNVLRVDFAAGVGRPSRKYMRGVLTEDDVIFNTIRATPLATLDAAYAAVVAAVTAFVDVDGEDITSGASYPFVGMRQLRRASKKKTTP